MWPFQRKKTPNIKASDESRENGKYFYNDTSTFHRSWTNFPCALGLILNNQVSLRTIVVPYRSVPYVMVKSGPIFKGVTISRSSNPCKPIADCFLQSEEWKCSVTASWKCWLIPAFNHWKQLSLPLERSELNHVLLVSTACRAFHTFRTRTASDSETCMQIQKLSFTSKQCKIRDGYDEYQNSS